MASVRTSLRKISSFQKVRIPASWHDGRVFRPDLYRVPRTRICEPLRAHVAQCRCAFRLCFVRTLILKKLRALSGSVTSICWWDELAAAFLLLLSGKQTGSKELPLAFRISENGQEQKHSCAGFQQVRLQDTPGIANALRGGRS